MAKALRSCTVLKARPRTFHKRCTIREWWFAGATATLSLAACAPDFPDQPLLDLWWERIPGAATAAAAGSPRVEATAVEGRITVAAQLPGANRCRELSAQAQREELTLHLIVRVGETEGCDEVDQRFQYVAVLTGLAPAKYHVRVLHEHPDGDWPVWEQKVELD